MSTTSILLVDDEIHYAIFIAEILETYGFDVRIAPDASSALESVAQKTFSLILLDIEMPGMDGLTLARRLRTLEHCAEIPIVLVSAHSQLPELFGAIAAGASGFLAKPFHLDELYATITEFIQPVYR